MRYLKAFTLIELLVSMAVSGIVITAGYVSYGIISRHYIDFKIYSDQINQLVLLEAVLNNDIHKAATVKRNSFDEISLLFNDSTTIQYEWKDDHMLRRTSTHSDTFSLFIKNIQMNFLGKEQSDAGGMLDELILDTFWNDEEFMFYFTKQYGADKLISQQN